MLTPISSRIFNFGKFSSICVLAKDTTIEQILDGPRFNFIGTFLVRVKAQKFVLKHL